MSEPARKDRMTHATAKGISLIASVGMLSALLPLFGCGSGGGSDGRADAFAGLTIASGPSPFTPMCNGATQVVGVNYPNSKVEPFLAVDPTNSRHLIGVWQQDRWSTTGSNGLITGVSWDGGQTWTRGFAHLSRCAGGNSANGGDYERASDPWVTISPDGTAYQLGVSFNASAGSPLKAILVSRSTDGGLNWSEPTALTRDDQADFLLDKPSITADPEDAQRVYAVWDRLTEQTNPDQTRVTGPIWFSRASAGQWEPARALYDPGADAQTISNQVAVVNGTLVNLFVRVMNASTQAPDRHVAVLRSTDKGATWSGPFIVEKLNTITVFDPKSRRPVRSGELVPSIAADSAAGKLYVTWQDTRFSNGTREGIALSISSDGGLTWSAPRQVNQALSAHAFTPSIAISPGGKLGIAYYDLRSDNPSDQSALMTSYWLVTSIDDGVTWLETLLAGPFNLRSALFRDAYFLGDYQGLAPTRDGFIPIFAASQSARPDDPTDIFVKPEG